MLIIACIGYYVGNVEWILISVKAISVKTFIRMECVQSLRDVLVCTLSRLIGVLKSYTKKTLILSDVSYQDGWTALMHACEYF